MAGSTKAPRRLTAARLARELEELNRIGIALSETRDVEQLLSLILQKAREITSADAGSIYLVEQDPASPDGSPGERRLRFQLAQNDSVQFAHREHTLALTEKSMAAYCALHGEVVHLADAHRIPRARPYRFNADYDEGSGYRTRSFLTLPMKNGKGEVLGVLQLLNCKRTPQARLPSVADVRRHVHPFPARAIQLGLSLASQAAVAYENSRLYRDTANLFDGFVAAAVTAIEQRDPASSGHSQRVCSMTLALAEAVSRETSGPYADVQFTAEQMKELRYAALLHDFGKVGIREEILIKAKKLYPLQFARIMDRFDYIRKEAEVRFLRQTLEAFFTLPQNQAEDSVRVIDEDGARFLQELEEHAEFIRRANEPTLLPSGDFEKLREIAQKTYRDPRGVEHPFLTSEEVRFLSIPRGSLDPEERRQVESHVLHSFQFLAQIPWTREFHRIPEIARAHHEKLNGRGYPDGLQSDEIPVQTRIMTICDIYDALSAFDRPYKSAIPSDRALDILKLCLRDREIDPDLFRLFVEARVFRLASNSP